VRNSLKRKELNVSNTKVSAAEEGLIGMGKLHFLTRSGASRRKGKRAVEAQYEQAQRRLP
jgi:hypothetical protein